MAGGGESEGMSHPTHHLVGRLLARVRPYPGLTFLSLALMVGVLAVDLAVPRVLGAAVDAFASRLAGLPTIDGPPTIDPAAPRASGLLLYVILYGGLALVGLGARFGGGLARAHLVQHVLTDLRLQIHETIQNLSFRWHDASSPGQVLARSTRDVEKIRRFYLDVLTNGGELALVTVGSLVIIAWLDWILGLIAIVVTAVFFLLVLRQGRHLRPMWRQADDDYDEVTRTVQETVAGARVIRAFGREPSEIERFEARTRTFTDSLLTAARYWATRMPVSHALFQTLIPVLLVVGGLRVMQGELTPGVLAAVVFYLTAISQKLRILGRLVEATQDAVASADRIVEMLDSEDHIVEARDERPLPEGPLGLHFEGVTLTREGDHTVLEGLDLDIPAGSTVAIVGPTGCGKSSLVSLIPRFQDPTDGHILLAGADLREYPLRELRQRVALVFQETFLFSASVSENIALGDPGASEDRIRAAARQAGALEFVEQLPEGFATRVGERGVTLSGGQKQRLAIARAYLTDPDILIMDDATSSVDSRTERGLREAVQEVARGRTTILIAQRFSNLLQADCIYVLDQGRLVEQGTHAELLDQGGLYHDLFRQQQVHQSLPAS